METLTATVTPTPTNGRPTAPAPADAETREAQTLSEIQRRNKLVLDLHAAYLASKEETKARKGEWEGAAESLQRYIDSLSEEHPLFDGPKPGPEPAIVGEAFAALLSVGRTEEQARAALESVRDRWGGCASVPELIDAVYEAQRHRPSNGYDADVAAAVEQAEAAKGAACPGCPECKGMTHHWVDDPDGDGRGYVCLHCPAVGAECARCDGTGEGEAPGSDCSLCNGDGVILFDPADRGGTKPKDDDDDEEKVDVGIDVDAEQMTHCVPEAEAAARKAEPWRSQPLSVLDQVKGRLGNSTYTKLIARGIERLGQLDDRVKTLEDQKRFCDAAGIPPKTAARLFDALNQYIDRSRKPDIACNKCNAERNLAAEPICECGCPEFRHLRSVSELAKLKPKRERKPRAAKEVS